MKVAFHTLGCKVNSYESQAMLNMFEEAGYQEVDFKEEADVYVINTCTVTNTGDSKSRQMIRKAIRKNPAATICVVGCYSQVAPQDIEAIDGVSIILGTQFRNEIVNLVEQFQETHERIVKVSEVKQLRKFEDLNIDRFLHTRAYLKIQDGCNNFCTYCIVPYLRGRERSRKPSDIIREVKELVESGFKDITLLGQNVNSYGKDLDLGYDFADLLNELNDIEGDFWLRFVTSHPKDCTKKLIDTMASCQKVCNQLHLPFQCGNDRVLKEMNRNYTFDKYLKLIEYAKEKMPDITLTSDVIVGFPGETDEEFEDTVRLVECVEFDNLFTFIYSKRTGTPAAVMENQIDDNIKSARFNRLLEVLHPISKKRNDLLLNKTLKVFVEGMSKTDSCVLSAKTEGGKTVDFKGDKALIGQFAYVKITQCKTWNLAGELTE